MINFARGASEVKGYGKVIWTSQEVTVRGHSVQKVHKMDSPSDPVVESKSCEKHVSR